MDQSQTMATGSSTDLDDNICAEVFSANEPRAVFVRERPNGGERMFGEMWRVLRSFWCQDQSGDAVCGRHASEELVKFNPVPNFQFESQLAFWILLSST
jgi:hypothetical protein